jgi:adenylate cyclase, class 2
MPGMSVEIEAKMKVEDLAVVRERLKAVGGTLVGEYLERNVFFDTEDRLLLTADEGLRLRLARDTTSGVLVCTITFKGPRLHGQLKSREETELTVVGFDDAVAMLKCLGYAAVLSFEKKRESWLLGGCEVELDELPHLGPFVEIEGPREETVLKVREQLQLSGRPILKASYIALLMTHLQEQGQSTREVVFEPPPARRVGGAA